MNLYKKALCFILVSILFSCEGNNLKDNGDTKKISINIDKSVKLFDCASILDTTYYSIIKLETIESSLIGDVSRLFFRGNKIYIIDEKTKSVFIFYDDGSYCSKIQSIGRSNNEYMMISDAFVSENTIFILDNLLMKVL